MTCRSQSIVRKHSTAPDLHSFLVMSPRYRSAILLVWLALTPALAADDAESERTSFDEVVLARIDPGAVRADDERRAARGMVPHYAVAHDARITPWNRGLWATAPNNRVRWRLAIASPGALSLNLAFGRYHMPEGGRLTVSSADGRYRIGPFTARDNGSHGELWTPPLPTDELILELRLPVEQLEHLDLELRKIHHGYAGFGAPPPKSGECHLDVACSEAEPFEDQARSVALISIEGVRFCSGFLVNNTALDGKPLFLTAEHCGVTPENASSVVVFWNHRRERCGDVREEPASWRSFQTGAIFRASYRPTDMVLLELDELPGPDDVYFAGWDRTAADPGGAVTVHHPNTDVQRISFARSASSSWHLSDAANPDGHHLRVDRWELGSTEGGSSGAPLFNRDKRVVGQLHGGYAACGDPHLDWFGKLSVSWTGGGRPGTRLSDWLDPIASGATTLDGLDGDDAP